MIVVKIGGSLITDKSRYRTFRRSAAEKIVSAISRENPAVVVHGGGSFGHIASRKYNLPGPLTEQNVMSRRLIMFLCESLKNSLNEKLNMNIQSA